MTNVSRLAGTALILAAISLIGSSATAQDFVPAVVFDMGGKFDKSFNEAAYAGAERFKKETGIVYRDFEVTAEAQREQALRNMARRGAQIVELSDVPLPGVPAGTRIIVRRERPHQGAQLRLWDHDGWRHQVLLTNSSGPARRLVVGRDMRERILQVKQGLKSLAGLLARSPGHKGNGELFELEVPPPKAAAKNQPQHHHQQHGKKKAKKKK